VTGLIVVPVAFVAFGQTGQQTQAGQSQGQPGQSQDQNIPDAPSAVQPPPPPAPSPQTPSAGEEPANQSSVPANQAPPSSSGNSQPASAGEGLGPPPPLKITTVPPGTTTPKPGAQEELYKLSVDVNQVFVPVRVTDESGRMVAGLLSPDFSVYEDGKKQKMNFFTSDPFALSAAVIFDLGMPDVAVQKVNQTFSALEGAFAPFDELSIYVYSDTVSRMTDFASAGKQVTAALNQLKMVRGENNGPAVTDGPLGPQGATVNNIPVDPNVPHVITPTKHARVLNDAVLAAARELAQRPKERRKIIFIVSDGKEYRSQAGYNDVLKVLLSNGIIVYAVAVEGSAIPGYNKLEKLRLPKMGYSDILPKYANATGGEVLNEYSRSAIESVYQSVIGDARNQYTLGYVSKARPSTSYREIEIRVDRPGCKSSDLRPCVLVYAKAGYYPLPPGR
jgi:VWFA-related protein